MSKTTSALIEGLETMLKTRGSMTVEEVYLLENVIEHLKEEKHLKDDARLKNGVTVLELLMRFLLNPTISENISQLISEFISKLP